MSRVAILLIVLAVLFIVGVTMASIGGPDKSIRKHPAPTTTK